MKNSSSWAPSKFKLKNNLLRPNQDERFLHVSSRVLANQIANFYSTVLPMYAKGDMLDLGCGNVPLFEAYKDLVQTITCIDWENTAHSNQFLDYTADLNQPLTFLSDQQFDTIILSDVLEHIYEPRILLGEIARLLKHGGYLIMNVPFYYGLHEEPFDYHRYTKYSLISMLAESQMQSIEIRPLGGIPEILLDLTGKQLVRIPAIGKSLCRFQNSIYFLLNHTGIFKKYSANTAQRFPLAYGVIAQKI